MEKVKLDIERCKACYLCMDYCPKKVISVSDYTNKKGHITIQVDQKGCIACGTCYTMCPDLVFEIL